MHLGIMLHTMEKEVFQRFFTFVWIPQQNGAYSYT